jgi:hypothetical protein
MSSDGVGFDMKNHETYKEAALRAQEPLPATIEVIIAHATSLLSLSPESPRGELQVEPELALSAV